MSERTAHLLIVEDDAILGGAITQRLKLEGFEVTWARSCAEAIAALKRRRPDFVLSDIVLPDGSGEELYRGAQPYLGDTPIMFATAFGEIDQAVRLVKAGADDYLTKPYDVDELVERIRARIATRTASPEEGVPEGFALSPATEAIAEQLRRVADTDLPVLLTGETGTGKEVAARYLHDVSQRASRPFVAVNCGATPKDLLESQFFGHERGAFTGAAQAHIGFFEEAGEGTLFLDEIGELDTRLQTALLRVLQDGRFRPVGARGDKSFKGRIVAATNADLERMRAGQRFRDDLYYRLSVIEIAIPPLRERRDEILPIAVKLLGDIAARRGAPPRALAADAREALLGHDWPGNIRELRNRLERASVLASGRSLTAGDIFPEAVLDAPRAETLADARERAERERIEKALALSGGRIGEAAKRLGISRTTLWKRRSRQGGD
ncbi:sigma-54 dependent transcriptional regulator [Aquamicrobium sp. LC103]|uniref:sigma-54-dependent transcriptional regulator n=1 Tax=Aquamicrobium sp. LC103 TaxID=1120658 RepID=UPI00063ED25D|nr:sigma-54 dependent transcriptional regulator [Aquamicrobium sp. LC103]TKT82528.1 sigma-54-dependent Fis family transcriptional regulator [Aquamicrobium sp. LC103]